MADFKRPYTKRPGSFSGKPSFGGARSGPSKRPWSDRESSDKPTTFHKATCSKCGNPCEVPFRPISGKAVLCRDCFVPSGERTFARGADRYPARDSRGPSAAPRAPYAAPRPAESNENSAAILKQLEMLNSKIERLIAAVAHQNETQA